MKRLIRRLAALGLSVWLLAGAALALTPEQLGTILKERYVGDVPQAVWSQTTVEGMLEALGDRFTYHLTREAHEALLKTTNEEDPAAPSVVYAPEREGVGRLTIPTFTAQTAGLLEAAVTAHDNEVDVWIVDLRGNRGGELSAAAKALAVFTGGGTLAYLRDKAGTTYAVSGEGGAATIDPVVVLVDGQTASAAELFAAGVRDTRAGLVVGSRTYGKGVAQSLLNNETDPGYFPDGDALMVSTYRAFSWGQNTCDVMGVIPHLMVADDMALRVARLVSEPGPMGDTSDFIRLHFAGWRRYVRRSAAQADPEGWSALLNALPPQAQLYVGTGSATGWREVTPAEGAALCGASYAPRRFPDVAGSSYADAINALKTYGILDGDDTGRFDPKGSMTRATLCALLAKAMRYPLSEGAPAFPDTPADKWYTPYITTLSALGLVNGRDDGLFHPDDTISHQEFMVMLSRIAAYTNGLAWANAQAGPTEEDLAGGDYAGYDRWAVPGVWLLDGLWHDEAKNIAPKAPALREEAAYSLWAMLDAFTILPG